MGYYVSDSCIGCFNCDKICPTEAIMNVGNYAFINDDMCIECGACASECPVLAICYK